MELVVQSGNPGIFQKYIAIDVENPVSNMVYIEFGLECAETGVAQQMQWGEIDIPQIQKIACMRSVGTEIHDASHVKVQIGVLATHSSGEKIPGKDKVEVQRSHDVLVDFQVADLSAHIVCHGL